MNDPFEKTMPIVCFKCIYIKTENIKSTKMLFFTHTHKDMKLYLIFML